MKVWSRDGWGSFWFFELPPQNKTSFGMFSGRKGFQSRRTVESEKIGLSPIRTHPRVRPGRTPSPLARSIALWGYIKPCRGPPKKKNGRYLHQPKNAKTARGQFEVLSLNSTALSRGFGVKVGCGHKIQKHTKRRFCRKTNAFFLPPSSPLISHQKSPLLPPPLSFSFPLLIANLFRLNRGPPLYNHFRRREHCSKEIPEGEVREEVMLDEIVLRDEDTAVGYHETHC